MGLVAFLYLWTNFIELNILIVYVYFVAWSNETEYRKYVSLYLPVIIIILPSFLCPFQEAVAQRSVWRQLRE